MPERTHRVNQCVMGWIEYFRFVETPSVLQIIEGWMRRRLRLCQWLQ
ncbi:group II intron maturase-specific domain-containing protein [Geobacillus sp. C56-T2]|nr:group II intron maturase-specific domain-containing protein [Geobacillus sp. C56-T2]